MASSERPCRFAASTSFCAGRVRQFRAFTSAVAASLGCAVKHDLQVWVVGPSSASESSRAGETAISTRIDGAGENMRTSANPVATDSREPLAIRLLDLGHILDEAHGNGGDCELPCGKLFPGAVAASSARRWVPGAAISGLPLGVAHHLALNCSSSWRCLAMTPASSNPCSGLRAL